MTAFDIYLIFLADDVKVTCTVIGSISLFALIMSCVVITIENENPFKNKTIIKFLITTFILLFVGIVTPSTKTLITMFTAPSIVNNEKVQVMPNKVINLIDKKLNELLESESGNNEGK